MSSTPAGDSDSQDQEVVKREPQYPRPGIWGALGWIGVFLAAQILIGIVVGVLAVVMGLTGQLNEQLAGPLLLTASTGGSLLVALAVVLLLFRSRTRQVLALRMLHPLHLLLVVLTVPPLAVVASEVNNWTAEIFPTFHFAQQFFEELAKQSWLTVLVAGCLLPGIGEEIYFRGFLGRGLVARHGAISGILLTSLLFGLIHLEPVQASSAVVLGIALHVIFLSTRSFLAPVLLHALNNALAFSAQHLAEPFSVPGFTVTEVDRIVHTPAPLVFTAMASLSALGLLFYELRTRWVMQDGREWSPGYVTAEQPPDTAGAVASCPVPRLLPTLFALGTYVAFSAALAWAVQSGQ